MDSNVSLRYAGIADAAAITDLINAAYRVEEFFVDGDRISREEVEARFRSGRFIVAGDGDALAGSVYVELRGRSVYIGLLSVDPSRQRGGLGSRLISAAEEYGRENSCRSAELEIVNLREELPRFYRRLGYVEIGSAPFPSHVTTKIECHFVKMSKALE